MATNPSGLIAQLLSSGGINGFQQSYNDAQDRQQQQAANAQALQIGAAKVAQVDQGLQLQQQKAADTAAYLANPTTKALAALSVKYPDDAKAFQQSYDLMDEEAKRSQVTRYGNLYNAANNGRTDLVKQELQQLKQAEQGSDTTDIDDALRGLDSGDPDQITRATNFVKGIAQMQLAAANPDFAKAAGINNDKGKFASAGDGVIFNTDTGDSKRVAGDKVEYKTVKNADGSESIVAVGGEGGDPVSGAGGAPGGSGAPLSVRLNNPGAIRANPANKWQGQVGEQNGFVQFDTAANGQRAHQLLIANQIKAGYNTPLAWAQHYAPASDGNDPQAYAATVAKGLGIGVNDKIPLSAVPRMASLSAQVEGGGTPTRGTVLPSGGGRVVYTSKPSSPSDAMSDDQVNFYAQKVAGGADLPPLGMGKDATALRQRILGRAADIAMNSGITAGRSNLLHSQLKANTQSLGALSRLQTFVNASEQTASLNADQVLQLAPANVGGSVPVFNRWIQAGRKNVAGDPGIARFNVAVQTLASEYAKVMTTNTGTGGVTSDSARAEATRLLNTAQTLPQLQGAVRQMRIDMANRKSALARQNDILSGNISGAAPSGRPQPTQTATNPKTGQKLGLVNGRWMPL